MPGGMNWDRAARGERIRRVREELAFDRTRPPDYELPVPVYQFDLDCGLRLGLVRVGGEVRYGRYDRTAGKWRTRLSPWMREEIDFEMDRLEREAAEREEGIEP
jgi:hypothetical protein